MSSSNRSQKNRKKSGALQGERTINQLIRERAALYNNPALHTLAAIRSIGPSRITHDGNSFRVLEGEKWVVMRGLTKWMENAYYEKGILTEDISNTGWKTKQLTGAGSAKRGKERGIRVHENVERWLNGELTDEHRDALDPMSARLIDTLEKAQMRPVCGEVCVFDRKARLCTSIDGLVLDVHGRLCAFELKTGYDSVFEKPICKIFEPPFDQGNYLTLTELVKASLQLVLGVEILKQSHGFDLDEASKNVFVGGRATNRIIVHVPGQLRTPIKMQYVNKELVDLGLGILENVRRSEAQEKKDKKEKLEEARKLREAKQKEKKREKARERRERLKNRSDSEKRIETQIKISTDKARDAASSSGLSIAPQRVAMSAGKKAAQTKRQRQIAAILANRKNAVGFK